ncbi:NFAT activation molecule 1 [Aulostomus maculatus]
MYDEGGVLLTSTQDVVDWRGECSEDLINPTNMSSDEEAVPGDSMVGSSISEAEVAEVVKKLLGGRALWVEEEELQVELLLLHIEKIERWLRHLVRMPPRCLPGEGIRACPNVIHLDTTVFVGFVGRDLIFECKISRQVNQSNEDLKCFDPFNQQIYYRDIPSHVPAGAYAETVLLKNLNISGEYYCQYKTHRAYWLLQLRDEGYVPPVILDYTEFTILAVFTGVLLVFSGLGSVYVFSGFWREGVTKHGSQERKQNKEKRKQKELDDDVEGTTPSPTSFYASLETRPQSIYDVLDPMAAEVEPDQNKAAATAKNTEKKMPQTTGSQDEGVFESVYENF